MAIEPLAVGRGGSLRLGRIQKSSCDLFRSAGQFHVLVSDSPALTPGRTWSPRPSVADPLGNGDTHIRGNNTLADTFLEINAFPDRLDLKDSHVKLAKDRGVKIILGSDTHFIANLPFMRFGIATARRGWLEKKDILNTYSQNDIEKILGVK